MKIKQVNNNPTLAGQVRLIEDVVYATANGEALKLSLLVPWLQRHRVAELDPRPLLVFVQGSSWQRPKRGEEIPQLVRYVHQGFVVATIEHRNAVEGHPFPAFLQDVKSAIRYLRAHAAECAIDPSRVALWGTSSGGNAALLAGLTGDDPAYQTADHANQSDAVQAVIACFAPTDVAATFEAAGNAVPGTDLLKFSLFGRNPAQWPAVMKEMSPLYRVEDGQDYPPFLLMHGDADQIVPYEQMEQMAHRLEEAGAAVTAVRVTGADHESDFWSPAIYDQAAEFLAALNPQADERKD